MSTIFTFPRSQATTSRQSLQTGNSVLWTPVQYRADAWFPPKHLRLPANKGNEAMVYLTFIIDNYHDFPPYAVFTHGHLDSWHQEGDLIALVRALNLEALEREKYIALRCDWYPSCPAEIRPFAHDAVVWGPGVKRNETEEAIVEAWGQIFPGEEVPQTLAKDEGVAGEHEVGEWR
ncbi:hypothetical protein SLS57_004490 [Botryosphaeria dothidea]